MSSAHETDRTAVRYFERLVPSWVWWLAVPGLAGVAVIVFLPLGPGPATAAALVVALVAGAWLWSFAAPVEVTDTHFRAGRARIERHHLGEVSVLDADGVRALMGPQSDARSHVLQRPWAAGAVRVDIDDPDDPCPYWLVSSRRPDALADALRSPSARR